MLIQSQQKLQVVKDLKAKGSSYAGRIEFQDSSGNKDAGIHVDNGILDLHSDPDNATSNSLIRMHVDNSEKLRITSTGLVGIGTITNWSPYKLQVAGGLGIAESAYTGQQAMSITNNSIQTLSIGVAYNALLLNKDGGNVGITEASPQRALHIGAGGVFRCNQCPI